MYIEWKNGIPYDKNGEEIQFLSDKQINEFHFHLDTEEEYERAAIAADYADFLDFMQDCQSMYATTSDNERYMTDKGKQRKVYPRRYLVCNEIAAGILQNEFDPDVMPFVPIVEFKLVPTGNVYYYDPNSSAYDRKQIKAAEMKEIKKNNKQKRKNIWKQYEEEFRKQQLKRMLHAVEVRKNMFKKENKDE